MPTTPPLSTFAKRLKDARLAAGLSQRKLAELAGCSRPMIVGLEGGRAKNVGAELIFGLADALNVSGRWLALGMGTQTQVKGIVDEEANLLLIYRALPPELKAHLGRVVQSLADASATAPCILATRASRVGLELQPSIKN